MRYRAGHNAGKKPNQSCRAIRPLKHELLFSRLIRRSHKPNPHRHGLCDGFRRRFGSKAQRSLRCEGNPGRLQPYPLRRLDHPECPLRIWNRIQVRKGKRQKVKKSKVKIQKAKPRSVLPFFAYCRSNYCKVVRRSIASIYNKMDRWFLLPGPNHKKNQFYPAVL